MCQWHMSSTDRSGAETWECVARSNPAGIKSRGLLDPGYQNMEERMEYIVLDLEWNQSNTGKEDAVEKLPFEIIEIGAIKLNKERVMVSEFNELVKPQVYHEMHKITSKLIHIQMQELERGRPFPEVGGDFVRGADRRSICSVPGARWI